MKKLLFVFLATFLMWQPFAYGQSEDLTPLPYFQGFDELGIEGWTFMKDGQVVDFREVATPYENYIGLSTYMPYEGVGALYSSSHTCTADYWAMSPVFRIENEMASLSWYSRKGYDSFIDVYDIRVSTTGNNPSDFSTVIYTSAQESMSYTFHSISLAPFVGQNIRIAIRHRQSNNQGTLYFDNFFVNDGRPLITKFNGPDYVYPNDTARLSLEFFNHQDYVYTWECDDASYINYDEDSVCYVIWDESVASGYHTVSVTVESPFGVTTATKCIYVANCIDAYIYEFPYTEDFRLPSCWKSYNTQESDTSAWNYQTRGYAHAEGSAKDLWLVSPLITLDIPYPELDWTAQTYALGSYSVYYSTSDEFDTNNFQLLCTLDSLILISNISFSYKKLLPEELISTSLYIAFRFNSWEQTGLPDYYVPSLRLSNIAIKSTDAPIIHKILGPRKFSNSRSPVFKADVESMIPVEYEWIIEGGYTEAFDSVEVLTIWDGVEPGEYTITLIATSEMGSDTMIFTVEVIECETITEFPYEPEFGEEGELMCWFSIDVDGDGREWISYANGALESRSSVDSVDNWLVTQAIQIPSTGVFQLIYKAESWAYSTPEIYDIYVSTTTPEIDEFGEYIFSETAPFIRSERMVSLADYAGEQIYIAFRHRVGQGNQIQISNIKIVALEVPTVSLDGNHTAYVGASVLFTASVGGVVDSYSWEVDGAQVSNTGSSYTTSFSTVGEHTIKVTASNAVGSTSAQKTITIVNAPVGIDNAELGVAIYPNPAHDVVVVEATNVVNVQVIDVNGRVLMQTTNNKIDISSFSNGVYYIKVTTEEGVTSTKIIKQ